MPFQQRYRQYETFKKSGRKPDFNNLLAVLQKKEPSRPTLFELFLNDVLYHVMADGKALKKFDDSRNARIIMSAYKNAGYDYVTLHGSGFHFSSGSPHQIKSKSLNDDPVITDRESYENYIWNDPESYPSSLDTIAKELPDGMKIVIIGPCGILENAVNLIGFDNLCYMLADDPELVKEIFEQIGTRLYKYYQIALQHDGVGAAIVNDDWGFNTQTMLSTRDMRSYVIPWHKKYVELIHSHNMPAIMHSCGNLTAVYPDIIHEIRFDGKHSYEDNIEPVEEAYERLHSDIAVIGGIDLDFICRCAPEEVYNRSKAMLERVKGRGGYALGSGNSIPYYVPHENYLAMIAAAVFD